MVTVFVDCCCKMLVTPQLNRKVLYLSFDFLCFVIKNIKRTVVEVDFQIFIFLISIIWKSLSCFT